MARSTRWHPLQASLDQLEPKLLMTSDVLLSALDETGVGQPAVLSGVDAPLSLSDIHDVTGVSTVHERFGIRGAGQTVVVIDSGVAYDHEALGGGLGTSYRVVGGWDFTEENDADPYDDGPAGFHGTHVAGILASSDAVHTGVAPEVDIVGLRVFNDMGRGKLSWLEDSLQWVSDHLNTFEHPITTVNLSIGTDWNSTSLPEYARLEDELAELNAAGVFVSVAAGNRFDSEVIGLSYPAVSPHVTAVSSIDVGANRLSDFSQRSTTALVAPGENIASTVPDYLEDFNGKTDDFYTISGTSMAAPYVAGASVLVRQAMQQAGAETITVESIREVLFATGDEIYDPQTNTNYRQINVGAAVQSVFDAAISEHVTRDGDTLIVHGTEGDDTVRVSQSGMLIFNDQRIDFADSIRSIVVEGNGGIDKLRVDANLANTGVRFAPGQVSLSSTISIDANEFERIDVIAAADNVSAVFAGGEGKDQFISKPTHSWMESGDSLNYIRGADSVSATANDLLDTALLYDSPGDDMFVARPDSALIHGESKSYAYGFSEVVFRSRAGGFDRLTLIGTRLADVVKAKPTYTSIKGSEYFVFAEGFDETKIVGNGGEDSARLYDSVGDDIVEMSVDRQSIQTPSTLTSLLDFARVEVFASAGHDIATLSGSSDDERFTAKYTHSWMDGLETLNYVRGFDAVTIDGNGGDDVARLFDSPGDDQLVLMPHLATLQGEHIQYAVNAVSRIHASAKQGNDTVSFVDVLNSDTVFSDVKAAWYEGADFINIAEDFDHVLTPPSPAIDIIASLFGNDDDRLSWVVDELGSLFR